MAVSAVSMLAGLIIVSTIQQQFRAGRTTFEAIEETRLMASCPWRADVNKVNAPT